MLQYHPTELISPIAAEILTLCSVLARLPCPQRRNNFFKLFCAFLSFFGNLTSWLLWVRDHWLLRFPSHHQSEDLALCCSIQYQIYLPCLCAGILVLGAVRLCTHGIYRHASVDCSLPVQVQVRKGLLTVHSTASVRIMMVYLSITANFQIMPLFRCIFNIYSGQHDSPDWLLYTIVELEDLMTAIFIIMSSCPFPWYCMNCQNIDAACYL